MKTLWNMISFLAVINLLGIVLALGWLWQSGRMNTERIQAMRQMFAVTLAEEAATAKKAELALEEENREREAASRIELATISSAEKIEQYHVVREQTLAAIRRLEDERKQLRSELAAGQAALQREREQLAAEQHAWRQSIADAEESLVDEQFTKAVRLLEALPAKQAKQKITELVSIGEFEQAVAYLNAMSGLGRAKIMREFKTPEDNTLATKLLERLRTLGQPAQRTQESPNANAPANAAARSANPQSGSGSAT